MGGHRAKKTWKRYPLEAATIVLLAVSLSACSENKSEGGSEAAGSPAATAASASAAGNSSQEEQGEHYELQAESFEQTPEGTKPDPLAKDSPIYVASGSKEASVSLNLSLDKRGDFLLAQGTGELKNGQGSTVPFKIDQVSVMHSDPLSEGKTLVYGGLTVNAADPKMTFILGIRYIPETNELELRLSNGEGLVVFGKGETLDTSKERIEELEADHRPRNAE